MSQSFDSKKYPRLLVRQSVFEGPTYILQRCDPESERIVRVIYGSEDEVLAFTRRVVEASGHTDRPLQWTKSAAC